MAALIDSKAIDSYFSTIDTEGAEILAFGMPAAHPNRDRVTTYVFGLYEHKTVTELTTRLNAMSKQFAVDLKLAVKTGEVNAHTLGVPKDGVAAAVARLSGLYQCVRMCVGFKREAVEWFKCPIDRLSDDLLIRMREAWWRLIGGHACQPWFEDMLAKMEVHYAPKKKLDDEYRTAVLAAVKAALK